MNSGTIVKFGGSIDNMMIIRGVSDISLPKNEGIGSITINGDSHKLFSESLHRESSCILSLSFASGRKATINCIVVSVLTQPDNNSYIDYEESELIMQDGSSTVVTFISENIDI